MRREFILLHTSSNSSSTQNRNHPELRRGEVWIGNGSSPLDARVYPYGTCRLGNIAYEADGSSLTRYELYPVFVQLAELERAAIEEVHGKYAPSGEKVCCSPVSENFVLPEDGSG
ncbi:MAG TPA: hypothetical protein VMU13_03620 [Candidatus Paceibacterota bacterium]|nr:hypothetical protein [Candidatus Paceibacterota bacterium]